MADWDRNLDYNKSVVMGHIASLFQATFQELAIFVGAFLIVTASHPLERWWMTYLGLAVFIGGLLVAAWVLMQLHSLGPHAVEDVADRYRIAWRAFAIGNAALVLYFLLWWIHKLTGWL